MVAPRDFTNEANEQPRMCLFDELDHDEQLAVTSVYNEYKEKVEEVSKIHKEQRLARLPY